MTQGPAEHAHERMAITGDLAPLVFLPWIDRHAAKLGLSTTMALVSQDRIEMDISGPQELIDMMEIGCLLGPIDAWVETIERWHAPPM